MWDNPGVELQSDFLPEIFKQAEVKVGNESLSKLFSLNRTHV